MKKIHIDNKDYEVLDTIEKMTVADSFVARSNKIGTGNGEAKFYVGNDGESLRNFFGNRGFTIPCVVAKKDFLSYMNESQSEYRLPQQEYRDKGSMAELWSKRKDKIERLQDYEYFTFDEQTQIAGPRVYVKSTSTMYDIIREISIPNITYISAIKLKDTRSSDVLFYFRLFVAYDYFGATDHAIVVQEEIEKVEQNQTINREQKQQVITARTGQGKYRKELLLDCPFCPITMIADDRLLIASHIKPWIKSEDHEKTDPKNGFMLTPTFDLLFDKGFISFTNDKKILILPWLSKVTVERLNIKEGRVYSQLPTQGREAYLEYHRQHIFKKS
jgi:putative restriction endonuclease